MTSRPSLLALVLFGLPGGLTVVRHTDYRQLSILGISQPFTVYAYGE